MAGFFSSLYGSKVDVPTLRTLNLGQEQQQATANNLLNLPASEKLVSQANQFSRSQIDQMLNSAIPGYSGMTTQAGQKMQQMISGELPLSDQQQLQLSSVAKSFGGGYGGSGAMGNLVARDLGLTELGVTQQGLNTLQSWMQTASSIYQPSMLNVSSMFVTPQQQATFDVSERDKQWSQEYLTAQVDAMADPTVRGMWNFASSLGGAIGSPGEGLGSVGQNASSMFGSVLGGMI